MFRITHYMQELLNPTSQPKSSHKSVPTGPVVVWNLSRRCNLTCKHCYTTSANIHFPDELSTQEIFTVMADLKSFHVPVLILSGGEPLLRTDLFDISNYARQLGFYVALSTNGTLINENTIKLITAAHYHYVGISLDGMPETHDKFRRHTGAFEQALQGIRLCRDQGIKVGIRFTLTQDNAQDLPSLLNLLEEEHLDKFYLSHLNYGGRGNRHRKDDVAHHMTREAMNLLFETCLTTLRAGKIREFVTGNNDADGVYLLLWAQHHFPDHREHLHARLVQWGGNSSGVNIANIDNLGRVHPDTFWWHHTLGNVKQRPFSDIWQDTRDPLMAGLKQKQRPLKGRCRTCHYLNICGGNTRIRAYQLTGDPWEADPGCYLSDQEINQPLAIT
jgi:heme d1 biosynthesis radical SAM protein NirJ